MLVHPRVSIINNAKLVKNDLLGLQNGFVFVELTRKTHSLGFAHLHKSTIGLRHNCFGHRNRLLPIYLCARAENVSRKRGNTEWQGRL